MRLLGLAVVSLLMAISPGHADVRVAEDGGSLRISGIIGGSDHCRAAELLSRHPAIRTVTVDSPGGDAWTGVQLARLFAQAGVTAVVPPRGRALSAAGIAVLGAPHIVAHGPVGLHGPYVAGREDAVTRQMLAVTRDAMRQLLGDAGFSTEYVSRVMALGARQMQTVDAGTLARRDYRLLLDQQHVTAMASACVALDALVGVPSAGIPARGEVKEGHRRGLAYGK